MSSMKSYMEQFRVNAGLTEAAQGEGSAMALQAALKQHFFKAANKKIEFNFEKGVDLYGKYQSNAADMGSRGLTKAQWDDRYDGETASFEATVDDISVEMVNGEPLIIFTFDTDESIEEADLSDLTATVAKIAKNIYPKSRVSVDDTSEDSVAFAL